VKFKAAIADLVRRGAQAVIFGCTGFGMLIEAGASSVPLIDTALAHAQAAVERALQESAARGPSDVSGNG
jgi:aspartate racemase